MQKKRGSPPSADRRSGNNDVIGRDRFAKISAVEGMKLSDSAKKRAADFDRKQLSPEERIRAIIAAHRKG
jgi:hypothetical protein